MCTLCASISGSHDNHMHIRPAVPSVHVKHTELIIIMFNVVTPVEMADSAKNVVVSGRQSNWVRHMSATDDFTERS